MCVGWFEFYFSERFPCRIDNKTQLIVCFAYQFNLIKKNYFSYQLVTSNACCTDSRTSF